MLSVSALVLIGLAASAPLMSERATNGDAPAHGTSRDYCPAAIGVRWTYGSSMRGWFTNEGADAVHLDGLFYDRAVPGTGYRDVRVCRNAGPQGIYNTHLARGIGRVGNVIGSGGPRSRLMEAVVGGETFTAAAVVTAPTGMATRALSSGQVEALALFAEVWGFVKYHHPAVTGGEVDWDAELFAVASRLVEADGLRDTRTILDQWLAELGDPPSCDPCARLPDDLFLTPEVMWIEDGYRLGPELSARLVRIHENRSTSERQQYVHQPQGIGNPIFEGEDPYGLVVEPDAGHRLLGVVRFWNIIRYWFPYRDLIDEDWGDVLREFIPRIVADDDPEAYALAMLELAGRTQDTHANVPRAMDLRPPRGPAQLPVVVRFIEGQAVVTGYSHDALGPATGLEPGDVITHLDGAPVDSLVAAWARWYPASNQPARLRAIARTLTRGETGALRVSGHRAGAGLDILVDRVPPSQLDIGAGLTHDLPGETFQWLTEDVAYIKLSSIRIDGVPGYLREARDAAVLVVDIRNYPSEFVPFVLGGRLVPEPTPFVRFTVGDLTNPCAFRWTPPVALPRISGDRFEGRVVVLVDETSISQSEYTAMALRAAPNTIVVGSTTAGADGDISRIPLPGGLDAIITGIGVFYPDRSPTQRIGIIPDLEWRPTIQGIRDGRDEVLEAGVSHALGRVFRLRR